MYKINKFELLTVLFLGKATLKPTNKEGKCLILNFYIMKNDQEMLEFFQVEELEKRYEMKPWLKPHDPNEVGAVIKL